MPPTSKPRPSEAGSEKHGNDANHDGQADTAEDDGNDVARGHDVVTLNDALELVQEHSPEITAEGQNFVSSHMCREIPRLSVC